MGVTPAMDISGPSDLIYGAFSSDPPWLIDPDLIEWLPQVPYLRERSRLSVPRLLRRTKFPPLRRLLHTGVRLGFALLGWELLDKQRGRTESRSGLSKRLKTAFELLGPTYIKLGQIISSGDGIFPEELVVEFKLLRDKVRPESYRDVREIIESELMRPLTDIFSSFAETPVAAASIAQVHRAVLRNGKEVVVKVQRPKVAELVRRDLTAMSWISPALIGRIPIAALANPPALVELFAETIVEELDFRLEGANMLEIARILADTNQRSLVVPRPHPRYVTKKVLVMERLEGFSWDDIAGMTGAGIDTTAVVRAGMVAFMEGALLYGTFHGDLHGGNLFVRKDGKVALLDYGITGRLDEVKRLAFLRLLLGGTVNDVTMQVEALRDLGALPPDSDIAAVIKDLGLDGPVKDPTKMTPEELTSEIRDLTKALLGYGAKMPKELMLFIKNMIFLDGSIATLAPDIDIFAEIMLLAGYFTTKHGERLSKDVGLDISTVAVDLEGVKGALGLESSVDTVTYREIQQRRELIHRRMEEGASLHKSRAILRHLSLSKLKRRPRPTY